LNSGPFESFSAANRGLNSSALRTMERNLSIVMIPPLMADPSLGEEDGSGAGQLDQCPEDYEQRKEPSRADADRPGRGRVSPPSGAPSPLRAVRNSPATLESAGARAGKV
jgi:hypothetical protein